MTAPRPLPFATCCAVFAATAVAQSGYDWDHPDGLGVRYLLYNRMQPAKFKAADYPAEIRRVFLPKSNTDWVRFKGTALAWGVNVYEFPAGDEAKSFAGFLADRDPRRAFRDFKVRESNDPSEGYWEFVDTWRPFVEILDRPRPAGAFRYAASPELSVRFLADKTMQYLDPLATIDGANCFARLMPETRLWIRIPDLMGPAAWSLRLFVFPAFERPMDRSEMKRPAGSFAAFVDETDHYRGLHDRTFLARGEPGPEGRDCKIWRWKDARNDGKRKVVPYYHGIAAVYSVGERQVALVGLVPSKTDQPDKKIYQGMEKMVTSLEPWSGEAKHAGFSYYSVASSCKSGDKEVAIVVYVPMGPNARPDRKLLDSARRMAKSLRREGDGR